MRACLQQSRRCYALPHRPNPGQSNGRQDCGKLDRAPLNQAQQQVLDDFMEMEVRPLSGLELLDRMDTPTDILDWFPDFSQTRLQKQSCPLPCFGIR